MSWAATPWRPNQTVNVNKILFYNISSQRVTHVDNDKCFFYVKTSNICRGPVSEYFVLVFFCLIIFLVCICSITKMTTGLVNPWSLLNSIKYEEDVTALNNCLTMPITMVTPAHGLGMLTQTEVIPTTLQHNNEEWDTLTGRMTRTMADWLISLYKQMNSHTYVL